MQMQGADFARLLIRATKWMRGRSTNWTRIRINLRNVPEGERPPEDPPDPDYDPWPAAAHG